MLFSKGPLFFFTVPATALSRRFSSTAKPLPRFRCTNGIPRRYKPMAIVEAQKALREYLHATKSLPFVFAELIANNSPFSLALLFPRIRFSVTTFPASFRGILCYEPINEFKFFFESIGLDYAHLHRFLPPKTYFFSQDSAALDAAIELSRFGFPWTMLGKLCADEAEVFRKSPAELSERLCAMKDRHGLDNLSVAGIVLAFPRLLGSEGHDVDEIFDCLKRVSAGLGVESCVEGNVDAWYDLCCRVRIFYDLGCKKGEIGKLMCEKKGFFVKHSNEAIVRKIEYFCEFGVEKADVGLLLLRSPEILNLDLEMPAISVSRLLEEFGLDKSELSWVSQKYPHVMGRNKMANLPQVMKALNLHEWCFDRIKSSNGQLLLAAACTAGCRLEEDREFADAMRTIESSRWARHIMNKVDFLRGIGFGENVVTVKVLNRLHGTTAELDERFRFLLRAGIKHSKLCLIIKAAPKILTQSPKKLERKLDFLCGEMGCSLEYLDDFPEFLFYDLEKRIKRRFRCYVWLRENALRTKDYSVGSLIASSEKRFVDFLSAIHRAAPKHYFERF